MAEAYISSVVKSNEVQYLSKSTRNWGFST